MPERPRSERKTRRRVMETAVLRSRAMVQASRAGRTPLA